MELTPKQRAARRYYFRALVADMKTHLTWREARLMWKGATVAALAYRPH